MQNSVQNAIFCVRKQGHRQIGGLTHIYLLMLKKKKKKKMDQKYKPKFN